MLVRSIKTILVSAPLLVFLQECQAYVGFTFQVVTKNGAEWWEDGSVTNLRVIERDGSIACTANNLRMGELGSKHRILEYKCDEYYIHWNPHTHDTGKFYTDTEYFGIANCIRYVRDIRAGPPSEQSLYIDCRFRNPNSLIRK